MTMVQLGYSMEMSLIPNDMALIHSKQEAITVIVILGFCWS
jgi:hypothetical protein